MYKIITTHDEGKHEQRKQIENLHNSIILK